MSKQRVEVLEDALKDYDRYVTDMSAGLFRDFEDIDSEVVHTLAREAREMALILRTIEAQRGGKEAG